MKKIQNKLTEKKAPVILFELLPPSQKHEANLNAYLECAIDLVTSAPVKIDAINIPEIHEDDVNGKREASFSQKIDSVTFAKKLMHASFKHIEVILNRCTVLEDFEKQKQWLSETIDQSKINSFVLIGSSSSKVQYPGPSVIDMTAYIRDTYKNVVCGGIAIQSRRHDETEKDEPTRMLLKSQNGIEFFSTQIIYESLSIKLLLRDYANICQENGVEPKKIILSFAPISSKKDLEFLRWLGVYIPESVEHELFKAHIGIGWRSSKIAATILNEILSYIQSENIQVPIGLNIEHITCQNFELSFDFIDRLGRIYNKHI